MEDLYFKNKEARLIFGLAELEGKAQLDLLGIWNTILIRN